MLSNNPPGPRLNIKTVFPDVGFHVKDKTVARPSYLECLSLTNGSLYW